MNQIVLLLMLFFTMSLSAQDPRLFENEWFLHDLVMDGMSNMPPTDCTLNFDSQGFMDTVLCPEAGGAGDITYQGLTDFLTQIFWLTGSCDSMDLDDYNFMYQDFWINDPAIPYDYEIIVNGDDRTLIITSEENNQAFYGNTVLNVGEHTTATFELYPNPATQTIFLELQDNAFPSELWVYDTQGKLVYSRRLLSSDDPQIGVSYFPSGFYFVQLLTHNGTSVIKPFVKR